MCALACGATAGRAWLAGLPCREAPVPLTRAPRAELWEYRSRAAREREGAVDGGSMRGVHSNRGYCLTLCPPASGSCLTRQPEAVMAVTRREGVSRRSGGEGGVPRAVVLPFLVTYVQKPKSPTRAPCGDPPSDDRRSGLCVSRPPNPVLVHKRERYEYNA